MLFSNTIIAAAAALSTSAFALPSLGLHLLGHPSYKPNMCISPKDVNVTADIFRILIQDYSAQLALDALTEDFVDYASGVNIIMNRGNGVPKDLTAPTFATRAAFMAGQGSQPKIPFEMLGVWGGCRHVSLRWLTRRSANGQKNEQSKIVSLSVCLRICYRSKS